jgi:hypothetical protein
MNRRVLSLTPLLLILICVACRREARLEPGLTQTSKAPRFPATAEEAERVARISMVKEILKNVYLDADALREVHAAISCRYYSDEYVTLKDLLQPELSQLYGSEKFRRLGITPGRFKTKFWQVYNGMHPQQQGRQAQNADYFIEEGITIYFPYSEEFTSPGKNEITLVAADRDADEGPGERPDGINSNGTTRYAAITVNDEYAFTQPTHIVGVVDRHLYISNTDSVPPPPPPTERRRVYNGYNRLLEHLDRLISFTGNGGGSEIKVCRISGYLKRTNQQVSDFAGDVMTINFSRRNIKKERYVRVYSVWDPLWYPENFEQVYAVWEEDTEGQKTFNGKLSTTISLDSAGNNTAGGEIGYSITVTTQDEIVRQLKQDRFSYFAAAFINQGHGYDLCYPEGGPPCIVDKTFLTAGTSLAWPIYDGRSLWSWTWSFQSF